jgi:hypothetical protein
MFPTSTHGTSVRTVSGLRVNRWPSSGPSLPWQVPHRATTLCQVAVRDVGDVAVIQICNRKVLQRLHHEDGVTNAVFFLAFMDDLSSINLHELGV